MNGLGIRIMDRPLKNNLQLAFGNEPCPLTNQPACKPSWTSLACFNLSTTSDELGKVAGKKMSKKCNKCLHSPKILQISAATFENSSFFLYWKLEKNWINPEFHRCRAFSSYLPHDFRVPWEIHWPFLTKRRPQGFLSFQRLGLLGVGWSSNLFMSHPSHPQ